jgi:predicted DsbA family dithiol-disulfide isomerase
VAEESSLVRLQREYQIELDWRGFELHPETPPGGQRLAERYGERRFAEMADHLRRFAAYFGIEGMRIPERTPNTREALAVAEWARDQGRLHDFRRAVMSAHWREGRDLEDHRVLADLAHSAGLEPEKALASVSDPVYRARVDAMGSEAARAGVTGIPTFIVGERRVVGCQPYDAIASLAEAAGAPRRI